MTKAMMPPPPPPPPPAPPAVTTTTTTILTLEDLAEMGIEEVKTAKYDGFVFKMSDDHYESFKKSIAKHDLQEPIVINPNGDVLDGHHRLRACRDVGKPPHFVVKSDLASEVDERIYVREINLERRHLTQGQRVKLALALEPDYAEKAARNMKAGVTLSRDQERVHVDERLAAIAGVSKDTIHKSRQIFQAEQENPEQFGRLAADYLRDKTTANKVYGRIRKDQARTRKQAELAEAAEKLSLTLPDKVTVLNLDSTAAEIPELEDNSVDLIITDPPYTADMIHLFEGLAAFAARKLKEGGSLVFYFGQHQLVEVMKLFLKYEEEEGLFYTWQFAVVHTGNYARFHNLGVQVGWKPMLWFTKRGNGGGGNNNNNSRYDSHKPAYRNEICDIIYSSPPDKDKHPWAQSPVEADYLIRKLTVNENALVVDPFLGSGAFGIAAAKLGRFFVGIEIDKDTCEKAELNIAQALAACSLEKEEEEANSG